MWSETIRTDANVEYMLFPRLLAIAERGWSPAPWTPPYRPGTRYAWHDPAVDMATLDSDWRDFAGRLAAQLPMLDRAGVAYRVAPPGGRIRGDRLEANAQWPGTTIEYRLPGGVWQRYTAPVTISNHTPVELRTRSPDGRRASRIVTVP